MVKIVKEASALEPALKPLIDASNTEQWKHVLNLLYLNGSVLSFIKEFPIPVLISLDGNDEDAEKMIDLLMGKAKTDLTSLIGSFEKLVLPRLLVVMKSKKFQTSEGVKSEEVLGVMAAMEIKSELEKYEKRIAEIIIQGAFSVSGMIAAGAFKALMDKRDTHVETMLDGEEYEEMIRGLEKLRVIEPRIQVSICSKCGNYRLVISPHPGLQKICTDCGHKWATLTLYTFTQPFDRLKAQNSDLPLFVSSYLRYKINSEAPLGEVEIYPKAVIKSRSGEEVEIDVFLPQYEIGIECKVFEDPLAPLTPARMGGIVGGLGGLIPQIKRYMSVNATNIAIITNLPADPIKRLTSRVKEALKRENIQPKRLDLIEGTVEALLQWLNRVGGEIAKQIMAGLEKGLREIAKPEQPNSGKEQEPDARKDTQEIQTK